MYQHIEAKKIITFMPSLLLLFSVCRVPSCGSGVDKENITIKPDGAMVRVHCLCNNNHQTDWSSSPMLGSGKSKVAVINSLLSIYCLTTGLHIQQVTTKTILILQFCSSYNFPDVRFVCPPSHFLL